MSFPTHFPGTDSDTDRGEPKLAHWGDEQGGPKVEKRANRAAKDLHSVSQSSPLFCDPSMSIIMANAKRMITKYQELF